MKEKLVEFFRQFDAYDKHPLLKNAPPKNRLLRPEFLAGAVYALRYQIAREVLEEYMASGEPEKLDYVVTARTFSNWLSRRIR